MIFLVVAIVFGSLFAILFKLFQRKGVDALQAIAVGYLTAMSVGGAGNLLQGTSYAVSLDGVPVIPALLTGFFMMGGFLAMNGATRSHGVAVATIAARVSFVIPVLCAYLLLDGDVPHWSAILLTILSLLLIFARKGTVQYTAKGWWYPVAVFVCYGLANFLLKYAQAQISVFHAADSVACDAALRSLTMVTFATAFLFTVLCYVLQGDKRHRLSWRSVPAGIVLGITNMGCTYFLLKSLTVIDASVFYPVYNISIVLIAACAGRFLFGERLSRLQYAGIAVAAVAILLFFG